MATVFRKTYTKVLPKGAELFTRKGQRFARWKDTKGKTRTTKITTGKDGSPRLLVEAGTYTAKYRDGSGVVREAATGCRIEQAARQVLADLVKRSEHVRSGILTPAEDAISDHQDVPLSQHVVSYIDHLRAKGGTASRIAQVQSRLKRVFKDCRFGRLADLASEALERWLAARQAEGMSAATRNGYREVAVGFGNWGRRTQWMIANPFANVPIANARADSRRHRRALTEVELVKLLEATQQRPLLEAMTVRRGKRKSKAVAQLRPETVARLELLGRERALIYKTLALTGLRKGELASISIGQLELNGSMPYARLRAADEKNRQGSKIQLRPDLVADIKAWMARKLAAIQADALRHGEPGPKYLPPDMPLLRVPTGLVRILDRDLKLAGIPKRDERGWTIDVHAIRHSFGTLMSKAGVAPRTAQAAMRHSSINLTMNVYTDPKLLDVVGALKKLPDLPLDGVSKPERQKATGTYDDRALAPMLAPNLVQASISGANADKRTDQRNHADGDRGTALSAGHVKRKKPLSSADNGRPSKRAMRFELTTFTLAT